MHSASTHRSACVDAVSRPSSLWATPRNPSTAHFLRNIANALSWLDRIKAGKTYEEIATEDAIPTDRVRKAIRYAFLAPDIVRAIVDGRQPVGWCERNAVAFQNVTDGLVGHFMPEVG